MIEVRDLSKKYKDKLALQHVDLDIRPGELIGLFGENGAGKTTLIKSILGLIRYQGTVTLDGKPIDRGNIARLSFATGEHSFFPDIDAEAHADFYAEHFGTA